MIAHAVFMNVRGKMMKMDIKPERTTMAAPESCIAAIWKNLFTGRATLHDTMLAAQASAGLSVVSLNVEPKCNLRCKHCFYATDELLDKPLSAKDWKMIIDQFLDMGVRHFHVCGREPFAGNILPTVMEHLQVCKKEDNKLHYGIITNGTEVSGFLDRLATWHLGYLDFSIDGWEHDHDFLRGDGNFDRTLHSLQQSISRRLADTIYVSTVVHQNNVKNLSDFILRLHNETGVCNFFLQPLQYGGRAMRDMLVDVTTYGELISLCSNLIVTKALAETNIVFFIPQTFLPALYSQVKEVTQSLNQYFEKGNSKICINTSSLAFQFHLTCLAFWRQCLITADGYYVGCSSVLASKDYRKYAVGRVTDVPIKTLYNLSLTEWLPKLYNYSSQVTCASKECYKQCFGGCRVFTHIRTDKWTLPECRSVL